MIWQVDLLLFVIIFTTAVVALRVRGLLAAVAALTVYSLFVALLFAGLGAVDVAFVEGALGAGLTGILLVAAVMRTTRRSAPGESRGARWPALGIIAAFVGLLLYASTDLPDRADPDAPANQHVAPAYVEGSIPDSRTPNIVTAILADYRSHDTLGETLVIFTAGLACLLVLRRHDVAPDPDPDPDPDRDPAPTSDPDATQRVDAA
jgi:multicomponent Na+:H+ antiporter subunit B